MLKVDAQNRFRNALRTYFSKKVTGAFLWSIQILLQFQVLLWQSQPRSSGNNKFLALFLSSLTWHKYRAGRWETYRVIRSSNALDRKVWLLQEGRDGVKSWAFLGLTSCLHLPKQTLVCAVFKAWLKTQLLQDMLSCWISLWEILQIGIWAPPATPNTSLSPPTPEEQTSTAGQPSGKRSTWPCCVSLRLLLEIPPTPGQDFGERCVGKTGQAEVQRGPPMLPSPKWKYWE